MEKVAEIVERLGYDKYGCTEAIIPIIQEALKKDCESCADGFISTHEKATNAVRQAERERITNEPEFVSDSWLNRAV